MWTWSSNDLPDPWLWQVVKDYLPVPQVDTVVAIYIVTCWAWIVIVLGLTRVRRDINRACSHWMSVVLDVCQIAYLLGSSTVWLLCVHSTSVLPSSGFISLVTMCQAAVVFAWLHWHGLVHIGPRKHCYRYRQSVISDFYEPPEGEGQSQTGNNNGNFAGGGAAAFDIDDEGNIHTNMPIMPTSGNNHCWLYRILQDYLSERYDGIQDLDDAPLPQGVQLLNEEQHEFVLDVAATVRRLKQLHEKYE